MKTKLLIVTVIFILMGLVFYPSCNGDDCDFNILGTWNFTITISFPWDPYTWNEILNFVGTEASGTVTGWSYEAGHTGTYTITNCTVFQMIFDYIGMWGHTYVPFNGTGTGNTISGTMSYYDDDYGSTYTGTFTAIKM